MPRRRSASLALAAGSSSPPAAPVGTQASSCTGPLASSSQATPSNHGCRIMSSQTTESCGCALHLIRIAGSLRSSRPMRSRAALLKYEGNSCRTSRYTMRLARPELLPSTPLAAGAFAPSPHVPSSPRAPGRALGHPTRRASFPIAAHTARPRRPTRRRALRGRASRSSLAPCTRTSQPRREGAWTPRPPRSPCRRSWAAPGRPARGSRA